MVPLFVMNNFVLTAESNTTSKFLGLDISTSCTGICILDQDKQFVLLDNIRLDKCTDFFEKCVEVKKYLDNLKTDHLIQNIFIEQDLQAFRPGLSSAATINTLARFNGAVTFMAYQTFMTRPDLINVTKARSAVGLKTATSGPGLCSSPTT
jgi:Ethanolamine utilization protein EutJ (predicted chaperonin)